MASISDALFVLFYLAIGFLRPARGHGTVVPANFDPLKQFCYRFSHQSAIVDDRLFIDGGYLRLNSLDPSAPVDKTNYSNPDFFYHDISTTALGDQELGVPPLITTVLNKKPADVPSLASAALWADTVNKKVYLYGGEFTVSPPSPFRLWMYDTLYDTWTTVNQTTGPTPARVFKGAGTVIDHSGIGYYLGGYIGPDSEYGYRSEQTYAVAGLLRYNMIENTFYNESIPFGRRAEGFLTYVPLGDAGLLIYFGGMHIEEDTSIHGALMEEIFVYDLSSSRWYNQTATGDIPEQRRLFCAGVQAGLAVGREGLRYPTHNIYLYGGAQTPYTTNGSAGVTHGPGYDDVYILSLPTFKWTKFWTADNTNRAHHSLTCNVAKSQMLILGGYFPIEGGCDAPAAYGMHNLNLSGSLEEGTIWGRFRPELSEEDYKVPTAVVDNLGLNEGNPVVRYDNQDLVRLFSRTISAIPTRLPTRNVSPDSDKSKERTIILATTIPISITFLAALLFLYLWYRRKQLRRRRAIESVSSPPFREPYDPNQDTKKYAGPRVGWFSSRTDPEVVEVESPDPPPPPSSHYHSPSLNQDPRFSTTGGSMVQPESSHPVAYVINPAGVLTPVYDTIGAVTAAGATSPPRLMSPRSNPSMAFEGRSEVSGSFSPVELPGGGGRH